MDQPAVTASRPLPETAGLAAPFWSGLRERRLLIQRCAGCGTYRFPPEVACFQCGSQDVEWAPVSGRAALYSWTVAHPPLLSYFQERAPWPVACVELEEGPRLITNLVDVPLAEYRIGMPLQADFQDVEEDVTLLVFRARAGREG